jgi:hypothetical protein
MAAEHHIYGEVENENDLKRIFSQIRCEVEQADSRPALTELYRRAGYLVTLTHSPAWEKKFGTRIGTLRQIAGTSFARQRGRSTSGPRRSARKPTMTRRGGLNDEHDNRRMHLSPHGGQVQRRSPGDAYHLGSPTDVPPTTQRFSKVVEITSGECQKALPPTPWASRAPMTSGRKATAAPARHPAMDGTATSSPFMLWTRADWAWAEGPARRGRGRRSGSCAGPGTAHRDLRAAVAPPRSRNSAARTSRCCWSRCSADPGDRQTA